MPEPSDVTLYASSKREVDKKYDKPSAYRSMAYVRTYLKNYGEKYGNTKDAYKGDNPQELKKWRKEKWVDVKSYLENPKNPVACGASKKREIVGYKPQSTSREYPLCMPIKRLSKYTTSELEALVQRKNQLGKRTLMKDAFLNKTN